ncbi:hypothetical protein ACFP7A_05850 [Sporolactobacillus kofuensis]|uniref:Citrate transporter n=1 Tax=Sporolactobacillus kofuensis TaxID=269672 RepID=A0ABW1WDD9_9BACL|nr:hypothetical protein [Sporolactobacillus kofuensis]MCO7175129.1 hypothetical protein [Sporolactobacillus kofuensis]
MSRAIYLLAILSYILATLFPYIVYLKASVSLLCMLAVLVGLRNVRGLALVFGSLFLVAGSLMLVVSHASTFHYVTCFGEMIQMIALFALIPVLSLPIRFGHYSDEMEQLINKKVNKPKQFYVLASGVSFMFSSFMNLAALPLTYQSIASSVRHFPFSNQNKYLSCAITHGYAMPLLWSPITPIVGTVLYMTGTPYLTILPHLLFLSIAGLLLDYLSVRIIFRQRDTEQNTRVIDHAVARSTASKKRAPAKLLHIVCAILILNGLITLLDHFSSYSFLFLVTLAVLPFTYLWCLMIHKTKYFYSGVRMHFKTDLPKMQNQFFIFLTAGYFITALHQSKTDDIVSHWVSTLIQHTGLQLFLILLPLIPFALAFIGLHPAIGLALISEALHDQVLQQAPIAVTIAMLGGAIPAFLMGPYNATLGMMSSLIQEQPFTLSNWNFPFTVRYLLLLTVFVQYLYAWA